MWTRVKHHLLMLFRLRFLRELMISDYLERHLYQNSKYSDAARLNRSEHQIFSQAGEDGILAEIFHRIGAGSRFFVEFGVGNGRENNSAALLLQNWQGLWLEGNPKFIKSIQTQFRNCLASRQLKLRQTFITAENIVSLFEEAGVPQEFDLLSIDIDGNDYHVWKTLGGYRPRVVVIEYNAIFPPQVAWTMPYRADYQWDESSWTGASLRSLYELGQQLGYELVACSFAGVNAFFVRKDLLGNHFLVGSDCSTHYEPARYFLNTTWGHQRRIEL